MLARGHLVLDLIHVVVVRHVTRSPLAHFLTGGLNLQSIHHCLPSISLVPYPAMYPKFRKVCEKHHCAPMDCGSMGLAIIKHWRYVYQLGGGLLPSDRINPSGSEGSKGSEPAEARKNDKRGRPKWGATTTTSSSS